MLVLTHQENFGTHQMVSGVMWGGVLVNTLCLGWGGVVELTGGLGGDGAIIRHTGHGLRGSRRVCVIFKVPGGP